MADVTMLFPDLFLVGNDAVAAPSPLSMGTPAVSIGLPSVIKVSAEGLAQELTAGVDNVSMDGPANSCNGNGAGSGVGEMSEEEIAGFE